MIVTVRISCLQRWHANACHYKSAVKKPPWPRRLSGGKIHILQPHRHKKTPERAQIPPEKDKAAPRAIYFLVFTPLTRFFTFTSAPLPFISRQFMPVRLFYYTLRSIVNTDNIAVWLHQCRKNTVITWRRFFLLVYQLMDTHHIHFKGTSYSPYARYLPVISANFNSSDFGRHSRRGSHG